MKTEQRLAEAAVELVADRAKKAKKHVRAAAAGDVDGVHDLRVAVRKIRAAISVLHDTTLPADALIAEDHALAELFRALGDARDDDVMLERITRMAQKRHLDGKAIAKLTADLAVDQKRARKRVRRLIAKHPPKKLFARIAKKVAAVAERPVVLHAGADVPPMLVRHFATSILFARWERVLAYETVLPASPATLHRLRIAIKKLRYAVDFFGDALGRESFGKLDEPLQLAQDILGDLHDHDVARDYLARHAGGRTARVLDEEDKDAAKLEQRFTGAWKAIAGQDFAALLAKTTTALIVGSYQRH